MTDFGDRTGVALVTGGSGGLGSATAAMLAERGADVVVTYRSNEAAAAATVAAVAAHGQQGEAVQLDLVDAAAASALVSDVATRFGGIHTLVHAAGPLVPQIHLSRVEPAAMRDQVEAEVAGFFNIVHPCLPHLREASGAVVAITTAATQRYPVKDGMSSVAKGAVEQLVYGLAAEEGRFGVRANAVGPGMLADGMAEELIQGGQYSDQDLEIATSNIPLKRFGSAIDVAEAVCFLASNRAGYISGQHLAVDGGYGV